jgi:DNA-binding IclR family transcriptional regulator
MPEPPVAQEQLKAGDGDRPARQIVPSVLRAVRILNALAEGPGDAGLAALSRRLDLPRSSTLALCSSLVETGLLERDRAGNYRLGPHVLELSRSFLRQADLHTEFQRALAELNTLPQQTIVCAVLQERDVVYIGRRPGSFPLGVSYEVGMRLPAHCAASGLVMLSSLSEAALLERYAGLHDGRLEALTPKSITSVPALAARVAEVRRVGYALDDEETALGMLCIGVAVHDSAGRAVGAVAVSLTKGAFAKREVKAVAAEIEQLAGRISERLGAPQV